MPPRTERTLRPLHEKAEEQGEVPGEGEVEVGGEHQRPRRRGERAGAAATDHHGGRGSGSEDEEGEEGHDDGDSEGVGWEMDVGCAGSGSGRRLGRRRLVLWLWMKKGRQGVGEQPRSDGGKDVGKEGSGRAEVSTNVTMAAGGGDNWHQRTRLRCLGREASPLPSQQKKEGIVEIRSCSIGWWVCT